MLRRNFSRFELLIVAPFPAMVTPYVKKKDLSATQRAPYIRNRNMSTVTMFASVPTTSPEGIKICHDEAIILEVASKGQYAT